jgi:CRP-like cAMP-binding protein
MPTADQLRRYPLFAGLGNTQLEGLASCMVKRSFARGAYIFHPGNPALNTYLIESGMVRIFFTDTQGHEFLLNLAGPRSVIGPPIVQSGQVRLMGAVAHESSVVLSISQEDLSRFAESSYQFCKNIYMEVADSARKLLAHHQSFIILDLDGRLAVLILSLAGENNAEVDLPISQTELAGWLGASRGRLNRSINHLQESGWIRVEGQRFIILDRQGLQREAEGLVMGLL